MLRSWNRSKSAAIGLLALACGRIFTGSLAAQQSLPEQQPRRDSVHEREVVYRAGAVEIAATLLSPVHTRPTAAVVIVHGSGSSTRDNPWTSAYAQELAQRGVVVLYPDKRGSGRSTGDWRTSSIQDLAADVRAGLALLRAEPGVDSVPVGIIGFSQGGYVASVVAAEDPTVSFAAVISGGTATLRDQIVDELALEAERRDQPLTGAELQRVRELYGMLFDVARGRGDWNAYIRAVAEAKDEGGALAYALRTIPVDSTHWGLRFAESMGDFDPMPYWDRTTTPALFVYGGVDTQIRIDESIARLRASPARKNFTIITLGANGHALFRDDVTSFLVEWIRMRRAD